MAKTVCSTSVFAAWNSLWDFCNLTQSNNSINELHLRLFISVRCRRRRRGLGASLLCNLHLHIYHFTLGAWGAASHTGQRWWCGRWCRCNCDTVTVTSQTTAHVEPYYVRWSDHCLLPIHPCDIACWYEYQARHPACQTTQRRLASVLHLWMYGDQWRNDRQLANICWC